MDEIHDISRIEFGILSADEIRSMGVCKIDNPKMSGPGTVYDERMGYVPDNVPESKACITCNLRKECWGHFGYIELVEPIMHPMYYKTITTFMKCFCKKCYRLLITAEQMEIAGLLKAKGDRRFLRLLEKLEKTNMCAHCSAPQPKIIYKSKDAMILMEYKQKKKEEKISVIANVEDIKKIFDDILDEDVILCGFDPKRIHPRNLILTVLPVIPPCSRPYVIADGNICDDDLTYQYIEIVKANTQLSKTEEGEKAMKKKEKSLQSLKFRIHTLFNNSKNKAKHPTDSRPLKGMKERLAGKGGRIRNNLMGKRVDFSARTVIGADPTLKLNQLGIPYEVAQIHTKPEIVTEFNIDLLTEIVNTGKANFVIVKEVVDGVTKTIRKNLQYASFRRGTELLHRDIIVRGNSCDLKEDENGNVIIPSNLSGVRLIEVQTGKETLQQGDKLIRDGKFVEAIPPKQKQIKLKIGDIVERQLIKGDIVLFNRQPTLHRGSMLAMEVVPMPYKSFRFNLAATKSFNADGHF